MYNMYKRDHQPFLLRYSKFDSPSVNGDQGQYVGCPDYRGEETDGAMFDKWSFSTTQ